MKLVAAIIEPFKVDEVREALAEAGVAGVTVTEVKGFGRQRGHTESYRGAEYAVAKCKIEVAIDEDRLDQVLKRSSRSRTPAASATARFL